VPFSKVYLNGIIQSSAKRATVIMDFSKKCPGVIPQEQIHYKGVFAR